MYALGAAAAIRVFNIAVLLWQNDLVASLHSPTPPSQATLERRYSLAHVGAIGLLALLVVGGVLFLRWLHLAMRLTQALGDRSLTWSPKDAVMGFIIPFVSFVRPYQVMRDLHDALAPNLAPEPDVQVRAVETMGYRQVEMQAPPPARALPHASIGAWWAFFWIGNVVANIASRQTGTTRRMISSCGTARISLRTQSRSSRRRWRSSSFEPSLRGSTSGTVAFDTRPSSRWWRPASSSIENSSASRRCDASARQGSPSSSQPARESASDGEESRSAIELASGVLRSISNPPPRGRFVPSWSVASLFSR